MTNQYDTSWDDDDSSVGINQKWKDWEKREWHSWLSENLSFPFDVKRKEDDDDAYFTEIAKTEPFRLGHVFTVIGIDSADYGYGIVVNVMEGENKGSVPLCDIQVVSEENLNYWPVREYVVWFANS
jgi:hypothetical protein